MIGGAQRGFRAAVRRAAPGAAAAMLVATISSGTWAAEAQSFLQSIRRQTTLASTVPANGDQNPYAVVVAPVSSGTIAKGDVLVTNFNNDRNLQGLGTTIVDYNPASKKVSVFAELPRHLPECPGGIGLTTAMAMLTSGWVIVGSAPSEDGTTATKGNGCLIILDSRGKITGTLAGADVNAPWGNVAVIDNGKSASLFVSNAGFGIGAPTGKPSVVTQATVLRIELAIADGKPPEVTKRIVIGNGFGAQADKEVFLIGPTGLQLGKDDTLYVSDAIGNRIVAIDHASTRSDSAGVGRLVTEGGLLHRPLAMAMAPNGHLVVTNGLNGQAVEIDPATGRQLTAIWIDKNRAQTPPGSGDLFGIAMMPSGTGFYFVKDEMNTLVLAQ